MLNPGKTGAKRQSWAPKNPRDALKAAIRNNPRASEAAISEAVWEIVSQDPEYLKPIYDYWFANNYKHFFVEEIESGSSVLRERIKERALPEIRADKVAAAVEKIKSILMDHVLSNGKTLRNATFGDCAVDGGWLSNVAKQGKPNQIVGRVLTEQDLINMRLRATKKAA